MKVGDGTDKTWADLPYFGGEDAKNFQVSSLDEITDTDLAVGDTAIVKTAIYTDAEDETNNKYSYTGYVYNGTAWAAMDGNYSAKNVFFDEDTFTVGDRTFKFTQISNVDVDSVHNVRGWASTLRFEIYVDGEYVLTFSKNEKGARDFIRMLKKHDISISVDI